MKWAETLVALAGELERSDLRNEVDDVGRAPHLRDHRVIEIDKRHYSSSTATVAPSPPSFSLPGRHDLTAGCLRRCSRTALRNAPVPKPWMMRTACLPSSSARSRNLSDSSSASSTRWPMRLSSAVSGLRD